MGFNLGSVLGDVGSFIGNKATDFLFSNYQANKAWSRQKLAAQSAHQWEVADLRAAGLNPILSATGGNGANLPSVAVAQTANSQAPSILDMLSTAQSIRNQKEQEKVLQAQQNLLDYQAHREQNASILLRAQADRVNTENYIPMYFNARMMDDPVLRNQMVNMYQTQLYKNALGWPGQALGFLQQMQYQYQRGR
nr:MAG TPA: minor capsid protein [Microviridae sp.]